MREMLILFWREVTPHSFRAARGVGGRGRIKQVAGNKKRLFEWEGMMYNEG